MNHKNKNIFGDGKLFSRRKFCKDAALATFAFPVINNNLTVKNNTGVNHKANNNIPKALSVLFLGTGAADWPSEDYPENKDLLLSGQYRGFSSVLINGSLLIDCGETVPKALKTFNIDTNKITDILITHSHSDHFNLNSINYIQNNRLNGNKINLWVHENFASHGTWTKETNCNVIPIKEFHNFHIDQTEILPVEANHQQSETNEVCLHYILTINKKTLFYALDGGWLTTKTWNTIKNIKLDSIIWDATWGGDDYYCLFSHNNIPMIRIMKRQLFRDKTLDFTSKVILSHLGRNYHPDHNILSRNAASENILTAYDGLELVI